MSSCHDAASFSSDTFDTCEAYHCVCIRCSCISCLRISCKCIRLADMSHVLTATPDSPHVHVTEGTGWSGRTWVLLVVLAGALFLDGLDISMVGVALPSIGEDLGMSPAALQWIVSGYVLGYGGLLLLGGRSADLLGRRSVFLFAVGAFGIASVASAFLSN